MGVMKPLTKEEVPESEHWRFQFDSQWTEMNDKGKTRAYVLGQCEICREPVDIPINDVRNHLRGIRSQMPGTHRKCKYPGQHTTQEGYVWRWMPEHPNAMGKKYVAEHIYVMSEFLGRPLDTKAESVHHIDGDKSNNDISNLQLRNRYHGKGVALQCNTCGGHDVRAVALKD